MTSNPYDKDWKCPECGWDDSFHVQIVQVITLHSSGGSFNDGMLSLDIGDHHCEFESVEDDCWAQCYNCGHGATVGEFRNWWLSENSEGGKLGIWKEKKCCH